VQNNDRKDKMKIDMDKKIEVMHPPSYQDKNGNYPYGRGRIDSPNGALKYFRERFAKFVKK